MTASADEYCKRTETMQKSRESRQEKQEGAMLTEKMITMRLILLGCVVGVPVLIGIGVTVYLLLTGKKDQRPSDRDERP